MIDVILDFRERVSQIEKYLVLVWISDSKIIITNLGGISNNKIILDDESEISLGEFLNNNTEFNVESELVKILKSNTILLFYNLIEGTISSLMNEFFGSINKEKPKFKNLENPIKKIWLRYKHKSFGVGDKKTDDYIINTIESIIEEIIEISPKSVKDSELGTKLIHNYDAYSSETRSNEISGNLDARKIRELFALYGLPSINRGCDSMIKVKNKRNSLAHGNETFAQVGSNFTIDELYKMKIEITNFLEYLLHETESFLNDKKYLKAYA